MIERAHPQTWDVFLSHNSRQKALVRKIASQLRELDLKVFFDEDSLPPAADVVTELGKALDCSRNVVLMITPDAVKSRWVALEMSCGLYEDPDARDRRLIPVLLEPTPSKAIPLPVRRLSRVDLTDPETRTSQYHRLVRDLLQTAGLETVRLPDPPAADAPATAQPSPGSPKPVLDEDAVPLGSPFYIDRDADREVRDYLRQSWALVTIRGHRGSGKSSLLARQHAWALANGRASCVLNFLGIGNDSLQDVERLFREVAQMLADRLDLGISIRHVWSNLLSGQQNLTNFLEKRVLAVVEKPVLLLFDGADRTFPYPAVCSELFSKIRFWHDQGASDLNQRGWNRLGLVVTHATDPRLWIKDLNQSPFNLDRGEIRLKDFDASQVAILNERYGRPAHDQDALGRLMTLVGGHPYLVRRALYTMATRKLSIGDLERVASDREGPFAAHLERRLDHFITDKRLGRILRKIRINGVCDDEEVFQNLWAAGIVDGETRKQASIKYKIYADYAEMIGL
jgi:hypothetical protein